MSLLSAIAASDDLSTSGEAFRIAGFVDAPESLEPGRRDLPEDVLKRDEELYKRICVSTSPLSL